MQSAPVAGSTSVLGGRTPLHHVQEPCQMARQPRRILCGRPTQPVGTAACDTTEGRPFQVQLAQLTSQAPKLYRAPVHKQGQELAQPLVSLQAQAASESPHLRGHLAAHTGQLLGSSPSAAAISATTGPGHSLAEPPHAASAAAISATTGPGHSLAEPPHAASAAADRSVQDEVLAASAAADCGASVADTGTAAAAGGRAAASGRGRACTAPEAAAARGAAVSAPALHNAAAACGQPAVTRIQAAAGGRCAWRSACPARHAAAPCSPVAAHAAPSDGGPEQLDAQLRAEFNALLSGVQTPSVRRVLQHNETALIRKKATSEQALRGLTQEALMTAGLDEADAAALKVEFPCPTTSGDAAAARHSPAPEVLQGLKVFGEAVLRADTSGDFIKMPAMPEVVPPALRNSIMIRDDYVRRVDEILETSERQAPDQGFAFVLTGTPGIGKSAMALYLVCCLAQRHQKVLYRYIDEYDGDTLVWLDFTNHDDVQVDQATAAANDLSRLTGRARRERAWGLVDGAAPPTQYSGVMRMIVLASLNPGNYTQFVKGRGAVVKWVAVWSLDELEKCRGELFPHVAPATVRQRFTTFGGVARFVLEQLDYTKEMLLQGLDRESAYRLLHLDLGDACSDVCHSLAHAQVDDHGNFTHWALGSPDIQKAVATAAAYSASRYMDDLVQADAAQPGSSRMANMLGEMHEHMVHQLAPNGWYLDPASFRQLQPRPEQAPHISRPRFTAKLLSSAFLHPQQWQYDDGQPLATAEGYFIPRSGRQAGYDAFINSEDFTILLQVTRDEDHKLNAEGIMSLLQRLPSSRPACILLTLPPHPPALARDYQYQSWTMRFQVGVDARRKNKPVFKRLVALADELPDRLLIVEQWVVPFPVLQPPRSSSSSRGSINGSADNHHGGSSSSSSRSSTLASDQALGSPGAAAAVQSAPTTRARTRSRAGSRQQQAGPAGPAKAGTDRRAQSKLPATQDGAAPPARPGRSNRRNKRGGQPGAMQMEG